MSGLERIRVNEAALEELEAEFAKLAPKDAVLDAAAPPAPEKPAKLAPALPAAPTRSGLLDLGWARTHISILEVGDRLGLQRRGKSAICPFHPDHNPSLSFHRNRFRCHAATCGRRGNLLDLVVGVLGVSVGGGLDWLLTQGYQIPSLDPEARKRWTPGRAGVGVGGVEIVVASGLLGLLPKSAGLILCALCGLADPDTALRQGGLETGKVEISYLGLGRRSGVRERHQISAGIRLLRRLGLVEWQLASSSAGFRSPSIYTLTVDASTVRLAVEKIRIGQNLSVVALDSVPSPTVKDDQNVTGDTGVLTLGRPAFELSIPKQSAESSRRESTVGRKKAVAGKKAPAAKKGAPATEKEDATAPPARQRRRRIRHPGFTPENWRGFP